MSTNTRLRLKRKIEKLNNQLLTLSAQVEESVRLSVMAIEKRDAVFAARVIDEDMEIDRREVDLEEECLEILALHQPVAIDLRHIIAVLKINKDLERAGDLAVNIAEAAIFLSGDTEVKVADDFFIMAGKAQSMLTKSIDAFVNSKVELAYQTLAEDDDVDRMKHKLHGVFVEATQKHPERTSTLTQLFLASRHLERIADLATNVAEEVIYMITGEIVRHGQNTAQIWQDQRTMENALPDDHIRRDLV
jgi:phosphate transport system protein